MIPRLDKFNALHPDIDVRIDASARLVDFVNEDIDVGIRFGDREYSGIDSIYLFSFELIPVCSPKLVDKKNLSDISVMKDLTLLMISRFLFFPVMRHSDTPRDCAYFGDPINVCSIPASF